MLDKDLNRILDLLHSSYKAYYEHGTFTESKDARLILHKIGKRREILAKEMEAKMQCEGVLIDKRVTAGALHSYPNRKNELDAKYSLKAIEKQLLKEYERLKDINKYPKLQDLLDVHIFNILSDLRELDYLFRERK